MYEKREGRLREERDAARAAAAAAAAAREDAEARLAECIAKAEVQASELQARACRWVGAWVRLTAWRRRETLSCRVPTHRPQAEREAAQAASEAHERARAEVAHLTARLAESEGELRALLAAVERQKASSAVKMRQLATLLSDLG